MSKRKSYRWIARLLWAFVLLSPSARADDSQTWEDWTGPPVEWSGPQEDVTRVMAETLHKHLNAGDALMEEGKFDEAIAQFQQALKIGPNHIAARMSLGIAYQRKEMWDQAIAEYQRVIQSAPDLPAAYNNLALAHWRAGRPEEAITALEKTIALDPGQADGYLNLGLVYLSQGKLTEAIVQLEKGLAISPDREMARKNLAIAHANLGVTHYNAQRFGEALAELKRAVEIDPELSEAQELMETIERVQREKKIAAGETFGHGGGATEESHGAVGELRSWEADIVWQKEGFTERPFIEVTLNGARKEHFLIDARTSDIVISQTLSKALGADTEDDVANAEAKRKAEPPQRWGGPVRPPVRARWQYRTSIQSFKVGDLQLKDAPVQAVLDVPEGGILGLSVIGRFGRIRLDLPRGKLGFQPYEEASKEETPTGQEIEAGNRVFSSPGSENLLVIDILVNDTPCKALIDPSVSSTVLSPAFLRSLGLRTKVSGSSGDLRKIGSGSIRKAPLWRIVEGKVNVRIGAEEIEGNRHGDILSYEFQPADVDVILGMPHLKGYVLTIDYRAGRASLGR